MRSFLVATIGVGLCSAAAADELTIVSKRTTNGKDEGIATSYIGTDHVRMAQPEGQEFMADLKTGTLTIIDGKKRTYSVISRQDIQNLQVQLQTKMKQMEAQRKQAEEQMKNMPPALREKMQGMMGGLAGSIDVKKTGVTRSVAGYACETWTVSVGKISNSEECLAASVPYPQQAWDGYKEWSESLSQMMGSMGMGQGMAEMQAKFKDMRGIPLSSRTTVSVLGRNTETTSEVTEIRKGPIPASAWETPAGFKKVESEMLKGLGK